MQQDYISFELELIESAGVYGKSGFPTLLCWVKANHFSDHFNSARIVVVSQNFNKEWHENSREIVEKESRKIVNYLKLLGIPNHLPEINGVVDTSDYWCNISLKIKFEDKSFYLNIGMCASGFNGKDAENLRALLRYIFELAGYNYQNTHYLIGFNNETTN